MEYVHENISTNNNVPAKIFINGVREVPQHWHNSIEILLLLNKNVVLKKNLDTFNLKKGDLVIINSNEVHSLHSEDEENMILTIQLPKQFIKSLGIDLTKYTFDSYSNNDKNKEVYDNIKSLMAEIAVENLQKEKFYEVRLGELIYRLVHILSKYFLKERNEDLKEQEELDRLSLAINEIREKYHTNLTLNDVAEIQGLSRNYFAQYFKKHMGITFLEFLNYIRMENAYKELISTNHTVTEVALNNGFPNTKSFTKRFKELFNNTPSSYRNIYIEENKDKKSSFTSISYFEIEGENKHNFLYEYIIKQKNRTVMPTPTYKITKRINTILKGRRRYKNPLSLMTFGRAASGLSADLQSQLTQAQKDIGFKYVRCHGILDDDMHVYSEDGQGNPVFNFSHVNKLVDFLISIDLKPFIELAFMPSKLAENDHILWDKSYLSMPKDIEKWNMLISALINNFIKRYGKKAVESWKFEVWNEPEYFGVMWNNSVEDYYVLWENTYKSIKKISKLIKVGGPTTFINTIWTGDWFKSFVHNCNLTDTVPDFLSLHFYPLDGLDYNVITNFLENNNFKNISYETLNNSMGLFSEKSEIVISSNPSDLYTTYQSMNYSLKKLGWNQLPIYLSEWNHTTWQRDLTSDTIYKSAYLVKNILENLDHFEGFGYWTISDIMEEMSVSDRMFHGGFGLITSNGIPKAGYYALKLLNNLGEYIIEQGENYTVLKNENSIQVFLYHYSHFDDLYRRFDTSRIDSNHRYNVFLDQSNIQIQLFLKVEEDGSYKIKETKINKNSGSAYDIWQNMGGYENLSVEEREDLKKLSAPKYKIYSKDVINQIAIKKVLEPQEVILIELFKEF